MSASKIHKYGSQDKVRSWDLPFVEDEGTREPDKTNAINKTSDWKYEPPEAEEEILPPTAEEIEAIRQSAYQEGLEQGLSEGRQKGHQEGFEQGMAQGTEQGLESGRAEGLAAAKDQIDEAAALWKSLAEKLTKPVAQVDQELETELVQLAVSLARAVIRAEVQTNEKIISQALSEGLKVLPIGEKRYQLHMNPQDIELLKGHIPEQEIESHHWQFIEAPGMQRGGCDIVTQTNAVDVTIERRVRQVLDKFLLEQGLSSHED
ncbi:flagellar assembly protein FliH [Bowmanella dokdonensis]|uniref:Flagellar assembly protein FliH n=1 Tax=Bowmanella dokdonensis TaxID=751969 RepID=A0A939DRI2_9ALTE|nr:flagellar assembly protein FliH [Bowmanella dokdonensis]MBN7827037.1 flagellar assembly protein FliH [Bowmanella dokdonensis]